jgi:hypothetical protein
MRIKPVRSQAQNIDNKLIPKKPKHQAHTTIKNKNDLPKIYFINISIKWVANLFVSNILY